MMVSSAFAYLVLEREKGAAEFGAVRESFFAFNDALEYVAWKPGASLPSRFTVMYGQLEVIPAIGAGGGGGNGPQNEFELEVKVKTNEDWNNGQGTVFSYKNKQNGTTWDSTGSLRYSISDKYITFGDGYSKYLLGNESLITMGVNGLLLIGAGNGFVENSYGRLLLEQRSGWVSLTLNYAIRMQVTTLISDGKMVIYVDVDVIRLTVSDTIVRQLVGDLQLNARTVTVQTSSSGTINLADYNGDGTADQRVKVEAELESTVGGIEREIENEIKLYFTSQGLKAKMEYNYEFGGQEIETEQTLILSQYPFTGSAQLIVTVTTSQVQISAQQK